jgi:hypothetical protein
MDVSVQLYKLASLLPGKKVQVPIHQKLSGPHSQSGWSGEEKIISFMPEIKQRLVFNSVLPVHRTDRIL